MNHMHWSITGRTFVMEDVADNEIVRLGSREIWEFHNTGGGMMHRMSMPQIMWGDADKVDYPIGVPKKIIFNNSSSRLHPMHIHGVFFQVLERNQVSN